MSTYCLTDFGLTSFRRVVTLSTPARCMRSVNGSSRSDGSLPFICNGAFDAVVAGEASAPTSVVVVLDVSAGRTAVCVVVVVEGKEVVAVVETGGPPSRLSKDADVGVVVAASPACLDFGSAPLMRKPLRTTLAERMYPSAEVPLRKDGSHKVTARLCHKPRLFGDNHLNGGRTHSTKETTWSATLLSGKTTSKDRPLGPCTGALRTARTSP